MIRLAIITNEPPPYRIPVFKRVAQMPGITLQVIFCARREPNRQWDLPPFEFDHRFLRERITTIKGRYIHNNPDVIAALKRFAPDVVVNDGLNPTQLYAFAYCWWKGIPHVPLTDGTDLSEQGLSAIHKTVRRIVYGRSSAYLAASAGGRRLFESYGVASERCFMSCLCVDNEAYLRPHEAEHKKFDLIFSGRIVPVKGPMFALDVAAATAEKLGRKVSILFVGAGHEEEAVRAAALKSELVDAHFHGFAQQKDLPDLYRSARVFLFPTQWDPWGVVANEACAAGLPVIVSPHAGVSGELVLNGDNGFVCALDVQLWADRAVEILRSEDMWTRFSRRSLALVRDFSFDSAAGGLVDACRYALSVRTSSKASRPV
jgi:glycosyltransferase involved in cell wall biosynthesis